MGLFTFYCGCEQLWVSIISYILECLGILLLVYLVLKKIKAWCYVVDFFKGIIDEQFCLFWSTVLIFFSIGLHLQSIVKELVDYIWVFIIPAIILLILIVYQRQITKKHKTKN